jgi:hypothetical protein
MHHTLAVQLRQRLSHPQGEHSDRRCRHRPGGGDDLVQRRAADILRGQPGAVGPRISIEQPGHPLAADRAHHLYFPGESQAEPRICGELAVHHFHRRERTVTAPPEVDLAHAARAQPTHQPVRPHVHWIVRRQRLHNRPPRPRTGPTNRPARTRAKPSRQVARTARRPPTPHGRDNPTSAVVEDGHARWKETVRRTANDTLTLHRRFSIPLSRTNLRSLGSPQDRP